MKREGFKFNNDSFEDEYELVHQMSDYTEVCCCAAFRILSVLMGYVNIYIDLTKTANNELDKNVDPGMMSGITDGNKFPDVKIMGAIVHPIFEIKLGKVDTGLCTETQYKGGHSDFLDKMAS